MVRTGTQAVQRAVALLKSVASYAAQGATLTEVANRVQLDRSTAHRLLQCLVHEGLLTFDLQSRRYRPGEFCRQLGLAASSGVDIWNAASPIAMDVAERTGETVFVIVRVGSDTFCVGRVAGSYPIKSFVVGVGTRRPLGVGAASLAMLAAVSNRDLEQTLRVNEPRLRQFAGLSAELVRRQVLAAKRQTYSLIDAINVRGLKAVGVAVPKVEGVPSVALSVGGIEPRVCGRREKFLANVLHDGVSSLGEALRRSVTTSV